MIGRENVADGRVEILLATYNGEAFLPRMLDSLLQQSYDDFHLVVADDGSDDGTVAILKAHRDRFRHPMSLLIREPATGSAKSSFSAMMEESIGDYVLLADQDDEWLPDRISTGLDLVISAESERGRECPVLAHTDLTTVDASGQPMGRSYWDFKSIDPRSGRTVREALVNPTVTGCTVTMNAALVHRAIPVPEESMMHDWWLNLVAAAFGHVVWDARPTVRYRIHGENSSNPRRVSPLHSLAQLDRLRTARRTWRRKYAQGEALLERFGNELPQEADEAVEDFLRAADAPVILRQILLWRGGFRRPDPFRNLVQLPFA